MAGMSPASSARGVSVEALVSAIGSDLLSVVEPGDEVEVDDITLAEPGMRVYGLPGDLLLAVGVDSVEAATRLVETAAERGVRAVAMRRGTAEEPAVREAARAAGTALVALADYASWAHVVWLIRGVLDGVIASGADRRGELGAGLPGDDLFALAEACAALVGAPVTIEDTRSRVLAHSAGLDDVDPIRLSTIVGRKVPQDVLLTFRARGVFRRMARSSESFFVPVGRDASIRGRFIVPVWAAGEWLGSVWAVVDEEPSGEVARALEQTARVVALHLLRLRSQSDLARSVVADRVRGAIAGHAEDVQGLPPGPWRVVALAGAPGEAPDQTHDRWESVARRHGWRQPLLTVDDDEALALVTDRPGDTQAGSWAWLRGLVADGVTAAPGPALAAGAPAAALPDLPRSRAEALEIRRRGLGGRTPAVSAEDVWAGLVVDRAARAAAELASLSPLRALHEHDAAHGTDLCATLAAWLAHPGDPRAAAATVHVHPNTLRHRVARVVEILGDDVDLSDPTTRLALQLHLHRSGVR